MNNLHHLSKNEDGFVLITALMMLVILTFLGAFALNTTKFELLIAGNDKVAKQTFFQADGGTYLAEQLTFENAVCYNSGGFTDNDNGARKIGKIKVEDLIFAHPDPTVITSIDDSDRDAVYYLDTYHDGSTSYTMDASTLHTNIKTSGDIQYTPGSGLQMVSGYEGLGSGAAGGGAHMLYTLFSQHLGISNSESVIATEWQLSLHLINNASSYDCNY